VNTEIKVEGVNLLDDEFDNKAAAAAISRVAPTPECSKSGSMRRLARRGT
jgi:hypothetical protein